MQINKILSFAILVLFLLTACSEENSTETPVNEPSANATVQNEEAQKICLLFNGENLGDKGFNDMQYAAAAKVQMEESFQLVIEIIPINMLHERFQKAINAGCDLLVATEGYAMMGSVIELAPKYPEKTFILMDEMLNVEFSNLTTTHFKTAEAAYLAGILAADMSHTGVLGIVAGADITTVNDFLVGFKQGAKDTRQDIKILTEYIEKITTTHNIWSNPNIAAQITNEMHATGGADVIFAVAGGSNLGTFNAAKKLKIKAIGVDADQDYLSKGVILTSVIKNLGDVLEVMIRDYLKGTLKSGSRAFGLADGGVSISPMLYSKHLIPPSTLNKITNARKSIIEGKIKVVSAWAEIEKNDAQK